MEIRSIYNTLEKTVLDRRFTTKNYKQSDANYFIIVLNLLLFHGMETYFHIDHARMTCVTVYLNLRTESQKHGNCAISEKKVVIVYIGIVELDQCCCVKNRWVFVDFCFS